MSSIPPNMNSVARVLKSADEFSHEFDRLWKGLATEFFKFERLQTYDESDNPSWESFASGRVDECEDVFARYVFANWEDYGEICRRRVRFTRVRYVELPLTNYLRWEFKTYRVSARYGERILIVDDLPKSLGGSWWCSDFLLFDEKYVLVHNYDSSGLLVGGWLIDHDESVRKYVDFASLVVRKAMPLGAFESIHSSEL